jgi:hypothetical protein
LSPSRTRDPGSVRNRIVEVLGEARGARVMITSIHRDGVDGL